MSLEEAHCAARRRFGNVALAQERSREMWGWSWLENAMRNVQYGLRQLHRSPGFTAVAVLTLTLGIDANTAIFSVVRAVLLRPLPYPDADRLVVVGERWMGGGGDFAAPDFLDIAAENHVFEQMAAYKNSNFNLSTGERPERVRNVAVPHVSEARFESWLGSRSRN
jgi:hypothetical protein